MSFKYKTRNLFYEKDTNWKSSNLFYEKDTNYECIEDNTYLSEILLTKSLNLFCRKFKCTGKFNIWIFDNESQLYDNNSSELLFNIFNPFYYPINNILYISPRWIYRKQAFVKKSSKDLTELYIKSSENNDLQNT